MKKIFLNAAALAAIAGMLGGASAFAATTSSTNVLPRPTERTTRPVVRTRVRRTVTSTIIKKTRTIAPKVFKAKRK